MSTLYLYTRAHSQRNDKKTRVQQSAESAKALSSSLARIAFSNVLCFCLKNNKFFPTIYIPNLPIYYLSVQNYLVYIRILLSPYDRIAWSSLLLFAVALLVPVASAASASLLPSNKYNYCAHALCICARRDGEHNECVMFQSTPGFDTYHRAGGAIQVRAQ